MPRLQFAEQRKKDNIIRLTSDLRNEHTVSLNYAKCNTVVSVNDRFGKLILYGKRDEY